MASTAGGAQSHKERIIVIVHATDEETAAETLREDEGDEAYEAVFPYVFGRKQPFSARFGPSPPMCASKKSSRVFGSSHSSQSHTASCELQPSGGQKHLDHSTCHSKAFITLEKEISMGFVWLMYVNVWYNLFNINSRAFSKSTSSSDSMSPSQL